MAGEGPKRLGFGRKAKLKLGRDFAAVRKGGERLALGCMIANWRIIGPEASSRLGVVTSSKLGNAVVRNRARRLLRECFRVHQYELVRPVDLVLVARNSIVNKSFIDVEKDFLTTLRKVGLLRANK